MGYCVYLRKSRSDYDAEAKGEGETLARHEAALLDLAGRLELHVDEIYREVVSGETIVARPVMRRLLFEVENGLWDGVLVMEVERLARGDTVDQGVMAQAFKYSGTKIITPIKTYDPSNEFDEEYFEFNLFMARREYKVINRRLQRGRLASVREGKYVGNIPPYGYVRKKLDAGKGYTLEPFPPEADAVRLIYSLYTSSERGPNGSFTRLGVSRICKRLNDLGIPPRKADGWVTSTIRDILMSPVYAGMVRWNWRPVVKKTANGGISVTRPRSGADGYVVAKGLHEALVDMETWNLAQEYLKSNPARTTPQRYELKNPLSGIVYCGVCGRSMVRRPYARRGLPDTIMCPAPSCKNVSARLDLVEEHILMALEHWLRDFKIDWRLGEDEKRLEIQTNAGCLMKKKLGDELGNLNNQQAKLHELVEQGVYSYETFLNRSAIISERINRIARELDNLEGTLVRDATDIDVPKSMFPDVNEVPPLYRITNNISEKNGLLKAVLEMVVYTKGGDGSHSTPDTFQLDIYPKLPKHGPDAVLTDIPMALTNWPT